MIGILAFLADIVVLVIIIRKFSNDLSEERTNNPKPKKRMTAKEIDEVFKQDSSSNIPNS